MRNTTLVPALSALSVVLLISSCATDSTVHEEAAVSAQDEVTAAAEVETRAAPAAEPSTTPQSEGDYPGGQQIIAGPDGVEFMHISPEEDDGTEVYHLHCQDDAALAQKAEHNDGGQPAGWPEDWDDSEPMPDPLCHPDYLEIGEWNHLEAHSACWEGTETSTLVRDGQSQDEINKFLWGQSQARADWEPNPSGGTCAEQWAEHEGGDPEDYADLGNAHHGSSG